jgi:hypothetical protein
LIQIEEYCRDEYLIQTRDEENNWVNEEDNECCRAFYDVEREQRWIHLMAGHLGYNLEETLGDYLWRDIDEHMYEVVSKSIHEFCDMPQYREHIRIVRIEE